MQISTIFTLVVAILASDVSAGCYSSGQEWGDHNSAKIALNNACNSLNGGFAPGDVKKQCRDMPNGQHSYEFEVENRGSTGQSITFDDCYNGISREIDGCSRGGDVDIGPIRYKQVEYLGKSIFSNDVKGGSQ